MCGHDTIYIIKFDKEYKTYKIIERSLHKGVSKVINLNNNEILIFGTESISKYSLDKEKNFNKICYSNF